MDANLSTTSKPIKPSYADSFKRLFGGVHFQFPQFKHDHPPVMNVNDIVDEHYTLGQRIADKVASGMGSWRFIIIQTTVLALWAILNSVAWWVWKWDAYPFIAMNLLLSCQAAYAAPVIMMSQNRRIGNPFHHGSPGPSGHSDLPDYPASRSSTPRDA